MENLKNRAAKIGTAVIAATASPLALAQTDYSS
jgi:hypothetical protein